MIHCDAYYIRESVFAPKTNLKTCVFFCCCFRRSRMRMTSLPIQLSFLRAQWGNIAPSFPRGSLRIRCKKRHAWWKFATETLSTKVWPSCLGLGFG